MSDRSPSEEAAYREGQVDAKLRDFERHFEIINGSIADTARALSQMVAEVSGLRRDMQVVIDKYIPQVDKLTADALGTKIIADALLQKRTVTQTTWERWRSTIAWSLGIIVTLTVLTNLILNHIGA